MKKTGLLKAIRDRYHKNICANILGKRPNNEEVFSNADKDSNTSVHLAASMAARIPFAKCTLLPKPQGAGSLFSRFTLEFLEEAFDNLQNVRPGPWHFTSKQRRVQKRKPQIAELDDEIEKRKIKRDPKALGSLGIADFDQYLHLQELELAALKYEEIRSLLGTEYIISPDIMIAREALSESSLGTLLVGNDDLAKGTPLRAVNSGSTGYILHASVSCKWTMRSDRAQNTRTESLNLIRNRKGRSPHIVAVTAEPLPSRLSSIALGMGDIDCTYHAALYELLAGASEVNAPEEREILRIMVESRRLRDISDLPFDLAI